MRKNIRIAAALASLALLSSIAAPAVGAQTNYIGIISATDATASNDHSNKMTKSATGITKADGTTTDIISYNATEFKKVLEIEDTTNIPDVSFDYEVFAPTANIPATYDAQKKVATLAVFKGVNAENITYKLENVDSNAFGDDSTAYTPAATADGTGVTLITSPDDTNHKGNFTLKYVSQNVVGSSGSVDDTTGADASAAQKKSVEDNVLINNIVKPADGADTYYAIKTVQMDFSGCEFSEPGIYRYYITESGANQGVTNDYTVTGADNCKRTIDVYVEDATYTEGTTTHNVLRIAGYVMYQGHLDAGPKPGEGQSPTAEDLMEDGLPHTNPSGNGGTNGYEVDSAKKSEGIRNLYSTSDITFGKTVTGNQASKDKYFKITLTLTDDTTTGTGTPTVKNVKDTDVFAITGSWDKTVNPSNPANYNGIDNTPNAATPYAASVISNASNASVDTTATSPTTTNGGNNVVWLTGAQLKAGYSFYLQDAQYISVHGLPNGIGYTLMENQDDYTPAADALDGAVSNNTTHAGRTVTGDYDGTNGSTTIADTLNIQLNSNIQADPGNTATITDTKVEKDVDVQFTNTRKGTIPTGVILSVAAPATIGIAVVGGIIYLVAKRKKDEDDEEE